MMTPMEFVLLWEGGLSTNAADPGGVTNWGISAKAYPDLDIVNLTKEQAIEIYERDYWSKAGCECLPQPLAFVVFNAAVNCGVGRAKRWLGDCGGSYTEFLRMQLAHYAALKKPMFIQGWLNRTLDAWAQARKLEASA